jgi:putative transposase
MPRKTLIRSNEFPYHVTIRANNREHFPIELPRLWKILEFEALVLNVVFGVEFQSMVLMPNHIHIILTVPVDDLGYAMSTFFSSITKFSNAVTGRSGRIFGAPYHWSIITSTRYYGHVLKYVYRNPVKAELCKNVEDYPFSTLRGIFGAEPLGVPLCLTRVGMELNIPDPNLHWEWLDWLNRPFTKEAETLIRRCLKKKKIDSLLNRDTRKPEPLLDQLL